MEVNSLILVWYHVEKIDPTWYPEVEPDIHYHKWWYGAGREYYFNVHIEVGNSFFQICRLRSLIFDIQISNVYFDKTGHNQK